MFPANSAPLPAAAIGNSTNLTADSIESPVADQAVGIDFETLVFQPLESPLPPVDCLDCLSAVDPKRETGGKHALPTDTVADVTDTIFVVENAADPVVDSVIVDSQRILLQSAEVAPSVDEKTVSHDATKMAIDSKFWDCLKPNAHPNESVSAPQMDSVLMVAANSAGILTTSAGPETVQAGYGDGLSDHNQSTVSTPAPVTARTLVDQSAPRPVKSTGRTPMLPPTQLTVPDTAPTPSSDIVDTTAYSRQPVSRHRNSPDSPHSVVNDQPLIPAKPPNRQHTIQPPTVQTTTTPIVPSDGRNRARLPNTRHTTVSSVVTDARGGSADAAAIEQPDTQATVARSNATVPLTPRQTPVAVNSTVSNFISRAVPVTDNTSTRTDVVGDRVSAVDPKFAEQVAVEIPGRSSTYVQRSNDSVRSIPTVSGDPQSDASPVDPTLRPVAQSAPQPSESVRSSPTSAAQIHNSVPNSNHNSVPNSNYNSVPNSNYNSVPNSNYNSVPNSNHNSVPNSNYNSVQESTRLDGPVTDTISQTSYRNNLPVALQPAIDVSEDSVAVSVAEPATPSTPSPATIQPSDNSRPKIPTPPIPITTTRPQESVESNSAIRATLQASVQPAVQPNGRAVVAERRPFETASRRAAEPISVSTEALQQPAESIEIAESAKSGVAESAGLSVQPVVAATVTAATTASRMATDEDKSAVPTVDESRATAIPPQVQTTAARESVAPETIASDSLKIPVASLATEAQEAILSRARLLQANDAAEFEIEIDPPELGRLNIRLTRTNGEVSARIIATEPATLELLQNELQDLRDNLHQSGVTVSRVDVEQHSQQSRQHRFLNTEADETQPAASEPLKSNRSPGDHSERTIDVRL